MQARKVNWDDVFPHYCKLYQIVGEDEFTDGEEIVIYEGKCRDEGNAAMRTYQTDGVMKSDHAVQVPDLIKNVPNDCFIDIKNDCVELKHLTMTNCQPFRYGKLVGTTIMYNEAKN